MAAPPPPDMSPDAIMGTNICGVLMTLTVFGSCLPSFLSIRDIQLKVSIALFFIFLVLSQVFGIVGWNSIKQLNFDDFGRWQIAAMIVYVGAFVSQSFYSVRRTCMIYNASPRIQLWLPIFMAVIQSVIQYTNAGYWSKDMLTTYGMLVSNETTQINIATISWFMLTEPVYFALLQYKIVQSATAFQRANKERFLKTIMLWAEAAMRLSMYLVTVLMTYLAVGDYLKPNKLAWWSMVSKGVGESDDGSKANSKTNTPSIRTEVIDAASTKNGHQSALPPKKTNGMEDAA
ncbi:hypothetical protein HK104_000577 [Borealophlyctis nickersoniae]|nr:hypothetical protein HK104_000577 [Borealophlyctis nickersoniae]